MRVEFKRAIKLVVDLVLTLNIYIKSIFIKKILMTDFLIIGAQKAGTTYLHNVFNHVKNVHIPTISGKSDPTEVRFFDERIKNGLSWYSSLFLRKDHILNADKTPKYYLLPRHRIWLIKKLNSDIKIIFVLRNPIERAWSDAVMNLLRFNNIRYDDSSKSIYHNHLLSKIDRGLYSKHIRRWLEIFPRNQLYIAYYDDLVNDPEYFVSGIFNFLKLNIESDVLPLYERVNSNPVEKTPDEVVRFLSPYFKAEFSSLSGLVDSKIIEKWQRESHF